MFFFMKNVHTKAYKMRSCVLTTGSNKNFIVVMLLNI